MKRKLNYIIDAKPMSRQEAETLTGSRIKNLTYGDYGFLIEGKWFPKEIIDKKSIPFQTIDDILDHIEENINYLILESDKHNLTSSHKDKLTHINNKLKTLQK